MKNNQDDNYDEEYEEELFIFNDLLDMVLEKLSSEKTYLVREDYEILEFLCTKEDYENNSKLINNFKVVGEVVDVVINKISLLSFSFLKSGKKYNSKLLKLIPSENVITSIGAIKKNSECIYENKAKLYIDYQFFLNTDILSTYAEVNVIESTKSRSHKSFDKFQVHDTITSITKEDINKYYKEKYYKSIIDKELDEMSADEKKLIRMYYLT